MPLLGDRTSTYMTHQQVRHVAWLLGRVSAGELVRSQRSLTWRPHQSFHYTKEVQMAQRAGRNHQTLSSF